MKYFSLKGFLAALLTLVPLRLYQRFGTELSVDALPWPYGDTFIQSRVDAIMGPWIDGVGITIWVLILALIWRSFNLLQDTTLEDGVSVRRVFLAGAGVVVASFLCAVFWVGVRGGAGGTSTVLLGLTWGICAYLAIAILGGFFEGLFLQFCAGRREVGEDIMDIMKVFLTFTNGFALALGAIIAILFGGGLGLVLAGMTILGGVLALALVTTICGVGFWMFLGADI